ncbi:macrocin-O-methyltransferase, partial [bacterium]|nr:macrocin-O-methyltransferase [bacterium]
PLRHVLELFPAYIRRYQMKRFLAHYDLFKMIIDVPGSIVELGVYRGVSLLTWAKLAEIFLTTDTNRVVYGFDSFQGLQNFTEKDGAPVPQTGKVVGGWSAELVQDEVEELVAL